MRRAAASRQAARRAAADLLKHLRLRVPEKAPQHGDERGKAAHKRYAHKEEHLRNAQKQWRI